MLGACQVPLVLPGLKAPRVLWGGRACPAPRVPRVRLGQRVHRVLPAPRGLRVLLGRRASQGFLVLSAPRDLLVPLEYRASRAPQGP